MSVTLANERTSQFRLNTWNSMETWLNWQPLHYTHMMHDTCVILSKILANVQQTCREIDCERTLLHAQIEHTTRTSTHTHFFIEIQYPGDALQSLVCLCRARWILRQMGCFSQTPKTFSQLLTAVYRYRRKTTNFHHAQQKVVVLVSIITT